MKGQQFDIGVTHIWFHKREVQAMEMAMPMVMALAKAAAPQANKRLPEKTNNLRQYEGMSRPGCCITSW